MGCRTMAYRSKVKKKSKLSNNVITANLFFDKTLAANIPVWILSLDLSKTFDRVDWGALWLALSEQGVSTHMLWILQTLYFGQHGEVTGQRRSSRTFQINAGVRHGCVLNPKMFSAVLHSAMSKWRTCLDLILVMACHHFWI